MSQSKKICLLTLYLVLWLLGATILDIFPTPALAQPSAASGEMTGKTVVGEKGVSLTSRQIGLKIGSAGKKVHPRPTAPLHRLNPNPQAPADSTTAGTATTPAQASPSVVHRTDPTSFPSQFDAFAGVPATPDDADNLPLQSPPDTMGAAGPSQFVMAINGMLRVFTKATGAPEHPFGANDPDLDTFFSSVMTPVGASGINYTTFPRLRYDRLSMRWFLLVNDVPGGLAAQVNRVLLAVSDGPTITSGTVWHFFYFTPAASFSSNPTLSNAFADNPSLGIDANALYIGLNFYNTTSDQNFINSAAFVVKKSSVLGTGPIYQTGFAPLINTNGGPLSPVGVDNLDNSVSDGYFIGVDALLASTVTKLHVRKVSNPGSNTPTLSDNLTVSVPDFRQPKLIPHKGGGSANKNLLDPVDYSLNNAVIRQGSLWTTHQIGVDSTGSITNAVSRDAVRWYEIALSVTPSLRQYGTIFDSIGGNPKFYWLPSLTVSGQGNTVLGFNSAGNNDYISGVFTGRMASDSPGTMRAITPFITSSGPYTPDSGDPTYGRRWGDYSFTSLDPEDDMTFWTIQEYAYNSDSFGIEFARIKAPPPPSNLTINPTFIISGQSNLDLTVSGTSVDGSAFFEPGPNFSKHITASIDGGVVVNSATYQSPTSVKLNISAVGVAPGQYNVYVTNPDGQTVTASTTLNVTCSQEVINGAADNATGSLRDALDNIVHSDGCSTISLANVTSPIILDSTLEIPQGVNITTTRPCANGTTNKVEITGSGFVGDGVILNGGNFSGLYIHGFTGRQLVVNGGDGSNGASGPTRLSCILTRST